MIADSGNLGDDGADALHACNGTEPPGGYSPPDSDSAREAD